MKMDPSHDGEAVREAHDKHVGEEVNHDMRNPLCHGDGSKLRTSKEDYALFNSVAFDRSSFLPCLKSPYRSNVRESIPRDRFGKE